MVSDNLVSIVIPVYNRGGLIGETLDSILDQTYSNWECIIVDDGSTDNTVEVVQAYCDTDHRIKLFYRPEDRLRGGNAARNFGLENCVGEYINWFDSDDIMMPSFMHEKLNFLLNEPKLDFVVSQSINFYKDGSMENFHFYKNNAILELDGDNFIIEKVHWLTPDMLIRRQRLGNVIFDDSLRSGQEFNFFIRVLVHNKLRGLYLDAVLTKVRRHEHSIQDIQGLDEIDGFKNKYYTYLMTYLSVKAKIGFDSKKYLINRIIFFSNGIISNRKMPRLFLKLLNGFRKVQGSWKTFILLIYYFLLYLGIDSYTLRNQIKIK